MERYLVSRGLTYATACSYELGVGLDTPYSKLRRRLLYPVKEYGFGEIVGYQGRILPGDPDEGTQPKAWHDIKNTGRHLFGLWQAARILQGGKGPLYVAEGPMDAMIATQVGLPTAAQLSVSLSKDQARLIACVTDRAVVLADSGTAGRDGAIRSCQTLWDVGVDPKILFCPDGHDPATLGVHLLELRRSAVPWRP